MSETAVVMTSDGHVRGVLDWTEGFKPLKCPVRRTEGDFVAYLMRLVRLGRREVADELCERYCSDDFSVLALIQ